MTFFLLSILAGLLTILAPCILPLLPVVIGASGTDNARTSKPFVVIASLSASVVVFTLLLKASTLLIAIPPTFWTWFSGGVIVMLGVVTLFPLMWNRLPWMHRLHTKSNQVVGVGHLRDNAYGDMVVGAALGPVFSTCSPTYLVIIATVLPASFLVGLVYLLGFVFGLALALTIIALAGQKLIARISLNYIQAERIKKGFGVLFVVVGVAIMSGIDKQIETFFLDRGVGGTVEFEEQLIEQIREAERVPGLRNSGARESSASDGERIQVSSVFTAAFPNTRVLSEDTGYERNYAYNLYVGYGETEDFFFAPSTLDERYPSKEIVVAFCVGARAVAVPWRTLEAGASRDVPVVGEFVTLTRVGNELAIMHETDEETVLL